MTAGIAARVPGPEGPSCEKRDAVEVKEVRADPVPVYGEADGRRAGRIRPPLTGRISTAVRREAERKRNSGDSRHMPHTFFQDGGCRGACCGVANRLVERHPGDRDPARVQPAVDVRQVDERAHEERRAHEQRAREGDFADQEGLRD